MTDEKWEWPSSKVVRLVDGDTFVAQVTRDVGFHGTLTFEVKLRLNRINAAPVHTSHGADALAYLQTLMPPGATVDIETVGPYKFGDEWVAEVVLSDGTNISDAMVRHGAALAWDGKGPRPGG